VNGWSFLLSRRWAGYLALTIVFALVSSGLGVWQFARRAEALVEIAKIDANYDASPVPVAEALPNPDAFDESQKWLPVALSGTYLTDDELLVRNRPRNVNPGFEVLTPLRLDDGTVFVVNRGWLPNGQEQDAPDVVPEAPAGRVTVVARLKAGEPTLAGRTASGNQIATINLVDIGERMDTPTYTGAYGLLASEDPPAAERPLAVDRPIRDEGPHLSYALQWFGLAVAWLILWLYVVRRKKT
jgi:cytochrome oxidase assembly protein ShyY1